VLLPGWICESLFMRLIWGLGRIFQRNEASEWGGAAQWQPARLLPAHR